MTITKKNATIIKKIEKIIIILITNQLKKIKINSIINQIKNKKKLQTKKICFKCDNFEHSL